MSDSWFDYDEYLQPRHLKGKRVTVTIARADDVEVDEYGKRMVKPVLYFKGTPKFLFLNKTMRKTLVEMFGDQKSACVGKAISIRAAKIPNRKDDKETIEILPPENLKPSAPLPAAPAQAAAEKDPRAVLFAVTDFHEVPDPQVVIAAALAAANGDVGVALVALEAQYGKVPLR